MKIKFHGHACFSINSKDVTWVTDPFTDAVGFKTPKLKANVVTESQLESDAHNNHAGVEGEPRVFSWPGEYETMGVHFKGVSTFHNTKEDDEQKVNVAYVAHIGGMNICHLGALGTKLTPEHLEKLGDIDVLMIPVGGKGCIDAKKAKEVVEQVEPRVVIPMMFNTEGSSQGLAPVNTFLSEMGAQNAEQVDEFSAKKSDLPDDNSKVVVIRQS